MELKKYKKKRDFSKTSEPKGIIENSSSSLQFVIQHHKARANHYDFRIENKGVLVSFAVPKNLSKNYKIKRLAIKVEDHPLDYINFSGTIPKGQYGGGTVEIWDSGIYYPMENVTKGIKKGKIVVFLFGEKLYGIWNIIKLKGDNWLIIKSKSDFIEVTNPKKKLPFKNVNAQLALLSSTIPQGNNWIFEVKFDGYRMISYVENGKVSIKSRNNKDYTQKFMSIENSLEKIAKSHKICVDGEIVVFDKTGRSDFSLLQDCIKTQTDKFSYVIFDILSFDGIDLRKFPLIIRKQFLKQLFSKAPKNLILSEYVVGYGKEIFAFAKKKNLEGIVAKNLLSVYSGDRNEDWQKIKCYKRQEFVVVGYTTTDKNKDLSAILLGYYEKGKLVFAGKVGTGFSLAKRLELKEIFSKYKSKKSFVKSSIVNNVIWLKPKLVAEIQFAEITKDKSIRQGSFVDLRSDKDARDVTLEVENETDKN